MIRRPLKSSAKKSNKEKPRKLSEELESVRRGYGTENGLCEEEYSNGDVYSTEEHTGWLNWECFLSLLLVSVLIALPFNLHTTTREFLQSRESFISKAVEMVKVGACEDAVTLYERALIAEEDAHVHTQLAEALSQCGRTNDALSHYMRGIRLEETNKRKVPSLMAIGDLYYKNTDYELASKSYETIVAILRDDPTKELVEAYMKLAKVDIGLRRFSTAYSHYTAASDLIIGDTMQAEVHYRMGHCALVMNKVDLAIENFKTATRKASSSQKSLFTHTLAYALLEYGSIEEGNGELGQLFSTNSMYTEERYIRASFLDHYYPSSRSPSQYLSQLFDLYTHRQDITKELSSFRQLHGILFEKKAPQVVVAGLKNILGILEGDRWLDVVDLGCGSGETMFSFRSLSNYILGIDLSLISIENAKNHFDLYDELKIGDFLDIGENLSHAGFDLVLCMNSMQYFGDLRQVFELAIKLLRPGGIFAFNIDILIHGEDLYDRQFSLRFSGRWKHDKKYIKELAKQYGLKHVHEEEIEEHQPFHQAHGQPIEYHMDGIATSQVYLFQRVE